MDTEHRRLRRCSLAQEASREDRGNRYIPELDGLHGQRFEFPLAAILIVVSACLFARAWWGHWLFMAILSGGAVVIVGSWFHLRAVVSPLSLLPAALLLFYYSGQTLAPVLLAQRSSATYDAFLFYVDRGFGFSPGILVYRWVGSVPYLDQFFFGVYTALSSAMGCCFAAHMGQARPPWKIVVLLAVTVTIGVLCYNLLPACGPLMLLGVRDFTHGDVFAAFPGTRPAMVSLALKFPRNAMPSLHMAWALVLLWISRDLRRGRWLAAVFAFLTAVATLSTGEHYLVDVIVAFPFALACWSLCVGDVPLSHPRRTLTITGGAFVYLAWIAVIRFAPGLFYASPVIPWLASIATVTGTLFAVYSQPAINLTGWKTTSYPRAVLKARGASAGFGD